MYMLIRKCVKLYKSGRDQKILSEVRLSMGLLQFFRPFVKKFGKTSGTLADLAKKDMGIHNWNKKCDEEFSDLKGAMTYAPVLVPPNLKSPLRGHIDAHEIAVGGALTQIDDIGKD